MTISEEVRQKKRGPKKKQQTIVHAEATRQTIRAWHKADRDPKRKLCYEQLIALNRELRDQMLATLSIVLVHELMEAIRECRFTMQILMDVIGAETELSANDGWHHGAYRIGIGLQELIDNLYTRVFVRDIEIFASLDHSFSAISACGGTYRDTASQFEN